MSARDSLLDHVRRSEIIRANVVTFDETGEEREVVRDCKVCRSAREVYGQGVVSPTGIVHITEYEDTLCGKNATGSDWWWPL